MPIRPKRPRDANQLAKNILELATGESAEAVPTPKQLAGRAGGLKGGAARAKALTPKKRSSIAKKAAAKRWRR